jgi:hypothetical protein
MRKLILGRLLRHRFGPEPLQRMFFERAVPPASSRITRLDRTVRIKMESVQNARRAVFFYISGKSARRAVFFRKSAPKEDAQRKSASRQGNRSGMGRFVDIFESEWKRPHGTPFHRPSTSLIYSIAERQAKKESERSEHASSMELSGQGLLVTMPLVAVARNGDPIDGAICFVRWRTSPTTPMTTDTTTTPARRPTICWKATRPRMRSCRILRQRSRPSGQGQQLPYLAI